MEKLQATLRIRTALWGKLERKPTPEAIQGQPCRLTLHELAPATWAGGQSGDMVSAVPKLYGYSLGYSAGAPALKQQEYCDQRASQTQFWKTTEASEEACLLASVHKALLPSSHVVLPLPHRHTSQAEVLYSRTGPTLTPSATGKDNPEELWLYSPLPCPEVCPSGNFLTSNKDQCPYNLPHWQPTTSESIADVPRLFHITKLSHALGLFFLTYKKTTW